MSPEFDKSKLEAEMLGYFEQLYGDFPEILTKIMANYRSGDNWNKGMTEAEIRQTVRILDEHKGRLGTNMKTMGDILGSTTPP